MRRALLPLIKRAGLWAALLWLPLAGVVAGCIPVATPPFSTGFQEVLLQGEGDDKILLIDIDGVISNEPLLVAGLGMLPGMTARVRQELELAYKDPHIRGVLLRINSPGGSLTDSDVIYHSLMEFKRTKKVKIVASMGDIAASGGFYIAMAADEVYAHPTTLTGSIGVIMPHIEYAGLMERFGVKADPITSGRYKDIDSPYRHRTKDETEMLQKIVDQQYQKFLQVVQRNRSKMAPQEVRALADGRLMTADDAKKAGLIDETGYLDDAYKRASSINGFPTNQLIRYANVWATGHNIYSNTFPIERPSP